MSKRRCSGRVLKILRRQILTPGRCCWYCGEPASTLDHIQPLNGPPSQRSILKEVGIERFSKHDKTNFLPACQPCNVKKSNRTIPEWRDTLIHGSNGPVFFWGELHLPPPGGIPLKVDFAPEFLYNVYNPKGDKDGQESLY